MMVEGETKCGARDEKRLIGVVGRGKFSMMEEERGLRSEGKRRSDSSTVYS